MNAIFYEVRTACAWRLLPHEFPPWQTAYHYFRQWRLDGTWEQLHHVLRDQLRTRIGRNCHPSAGIIYSQSVRTTRVGGVRGYDGAKRVNGRNRHILVDSLSPALVLLRAIAASSERIPWRLAQALGCGADFRLAVSKSKIQPRLRAALWPRLERAVLLKPFQSPPVAAFLAARV